MQNKIITIVFALSLLYGSVLAQQNYRFEPSPWAFSWGVGLGSITPTGDLGLTTIYPTKIMNPEK